MDIQYFGANCIRLSAKKISVVVDDNLKMLGGKEVSPKPTLSIYTQKRFNQNGAEGFVIDSPGEYEVSGVSVMGFSTRAHTDHEGEKTAVVYRIVMGGVIACIVGHVDPELTDEQFEKLGTVDVLFVPVGGNGYTLDAKSATKLVKAIEPRIIIPTHYEEAGIKFEVPQSPIDEFLKEIGATPEKVDILKLKLGALPLDSQVFYQLSKTT